MPTHTVSQGESIISIASSYGFFWKTIWEHGSNASLKEKRKNPNVLLVGDEVFIPEKKLKEVTKGTDGSHKFKRKGEPVKLKLQLKMMDEPRANEKYSLDIGGKLIKGTTDGDGNLEEFIPNNASSATLILKDGKEQYSIRIGELDPVDEISGIQQRLNNLGFDCGSDAGELGEATKEALKKFQARHELTVTGEPDGATKSKLGELHQ